MRFQPQRLYTEKNESGGLAGSQVRVINYTYLRPCGQYERGVEKARELHVPGSGTCNYLAQVRVLHVPDPGTCNPGSDVFPVRVIYTYLSGT